jgi:hypothetical protein
MAMLLRSAFGLILVSALLPFPSAAQSPFSAHLDAILVHDYRWRGILRATGWNAQLEATGRIGGAKTGLAAGVWSNFELGTHKNGGLTDLRADHWGLSETSFWGELAHSFGGGDIAAGFIWYEYRGRAGELGTGEVYGRLRGSGQGKSSIAPEISFWYDVAKRKSAYLEAGATAPVLALPFRSIEAMAYVGATAGFAIRDPVRRPELAATTFDGTGFTSADLSAGLRVHSQKTLQGFLLNLAGHAQYAHDPATRRKRLTPPDMSRAVRFYLTLGIGFRWPAPPDP